MMGGSEHFLDLMQKASAVGSDFYSWAKSFKEDRTWRAGNHRRPINFLSLMGSVADLAVFVKPVAPNVFACVKGAAGVCKVAKAAHENGVLSLETQTVLVQGVVETAVAILPVSPRIESLPRWLGVAGLVKSLQPVERFWELKKYVLENQRIGRWFFKKKDLTTLTWPALMMEIRSNADLENYLLLTVELRTFRCYLKKNLVLEVYVLKQEAAGFDTKEWYFDRGSLEQWIQTKPNEAPRNWPATLLPLRWDYFKPDADLQKRIDAGVQRGVNYYQRVQEISGNNRGNRFCRNLARIGN